MAAWRPVAATVPSRLSSKIIIPFTFRPGGGRCEIGFVGFFGAPGEKKKIPIWQPNIRQELPTVISI